MEIVFSGLFLFAERRATIGVLMPESAKHRHTPYLYHPDGKTLPRR